MTGAFHPFHFLLVALAGWLNRHQQHVIDYLFGGKPNPQRTVTRATISEALTGVRNVGDTRHVAEMASEIDRSKMDVYPQGARATADIERALSP